MTSPDSHILSKINQIRDKGRYTSDQHDKSVSVLHNHYSVFDNFRRGIYISAEIIYDNLNKGSKPNYMSRRFVELYGVIPGDFPKQLIGKRLGGPEHMFNVVPVSSSIYLARWEKDEKTVYEHVKEGKGKTKAHVIFALEYDDDGDYFCRAIRIYYHFVLYSENGEIVENGIMEGVVENLVPEKK